jgi:hypothetical protein
MKKNIITVFFGILLFGSIWGILEATLGNLLHFIGLHPYTGLIMTSIGTGLMAFARSLYKVRWTGLFMAVIAAALKSLDLLIAGSNVFRPMIAIILAGMIFEGVLYVSDKTKVMDKVRVPNLVRAGQGFAIGYLAIIAFVFVAAYVLSHKYWLGMGFLGLLKYLLVEGWRFGIGGIIMFLVGWNFVNLINLKLPLRVIISSKYFYAISLIFTVLAFALTPVI